METPIHPMTSLFDQLGLDSSEGAIEDFIDRNRPLAGDIELHQAEFWNPSQAAFLRQEKLEDADWVEVIDELDALLRYPHD